MICFVFKVGWIFVHAVNSMRVTEMERRHATSMTTERHASYAEGCPINFSRQKDGKCTACPLGMHGINCAESCPDDFYGVLCTYQCNCTATEDCDKRLGCTNIQTVSGAIVTSQILNYDTSAGSSTFGYITNTVLKEKKLSSSTSYQVYLRYVGGGLAFVSVISILTTVGLKRSEFNKRDCRRAVREHMVEEVALQSISDANSSYTQESIYANVYTEIIDVQGVNLEPGNGNEGVSRKSSSDTNSLPECGYLDIIAVIEHENSPLHTGIKCASFDSENIPNCGYSDAIAVREKDCSFTKIDDGTTIEDEPADFIEARTFDTRETISDCYSEGI